MNTRAPRRGLTDRMVKRAWRFGAAVLALGAAGFTQPLAGQEPAPGPGDERLAVMNAVLQFRLTWLEDTTPVDVCSVYEHSGRPAGFPAELQPELRNALGLLSGVEAVTAPPVCPAPIGAAPRERRIQFEHVTVGDTLAAVRMLVRKGEQVHREDYVVKMGIVGGWRAVEMRLWGPTYYYSPRRDGNR